MKPEELRHLLEMAAKAYGIEVRFTESPRGGCVRVVDGDDAGWWHPNDDDGESRRLEVKLGFTVNPYKRGVFVSRFEGEAVIREPWTDDRCKTTRLAVLRAAAAIGEAMP